MLRGQKPDSFGEIDEHDAPTEPMAQVILSPFSSTTSFSNGGSRVSPGEAGTPAPEVYEQPFPQQANFAQPGSFYRPPEAQVYPILPPTPAIGNGRPAGGVAPVQTNGYGFPGRLKSAQPRRSSFPVWVGLFLVAVQLLLLVRFGLQLTGQSASTQWVSLIYSVSSVFLFPFRVLLQSLLSSLSISPDLFDLLAIIFAILMYGLLSRFLVRFLKALLHSR